MKVGRQEVIDWADSLWCDGDINVVQESHEVFVRLLIGAGLPARPDVGLERKRAGIKGSPCSPPSAWVMTWACPWVSCHTNWDCWP